MLNNAQLDQVKVKLFSDSEVSVFAVVDGASCPDLRYKIYDLEPESECLWSGELEPDVEETAPYLIKLDYKHEFTDWLISQSWGSHWNIFISTALPFNKLRMQLKKLQLVRSPEGQTLLFRFYDPRVIKLFLPTCDQEQLTEIFDNLDIISCEGDEENTMILHRVDANSSELKIETLPLE